MLIIIVVTTLHHGTAQCAVPCLRDNGVKFSCIQGAGSDSESNQCVCDALDGPDTEVILDCMVEMCQTEDLVSYFNQICAVSTVRTPTYTSAISSLFARM